MKNKKLVQLMTCGVLAAAMLAGCGSQAAPTATEAAATAVPETTAAAVSETTAAAVQETTVPTGEQVVNVYSARHYDVDKALFAQFEEETGIKVNLVEGKAPELIERLIREGENTEADVFLTVGGEHIATLQENDLIEQTTSETIQANIPAAMRGENWTGLTARARVIAYDKDRVNPEDIKTYDDLLKEQFTGKVLARSSGSSYNVALLASFIQLNGEEAARDWAAGVVSQFARQPEGNDRDQVKAIAAGIGDVAIINSYYLAKMVNSSDPEEVKASSNIGLIFPEKTHLNISFASVIKGTEHKENALKLIDFLTGETAQTAYTQQNGEFPLNPSVELPALLASWGTFETQGLDYEKLGTYKQQATMIFDQVGWK